MTAQASEFINWNGDQYSIAAIEHDWPFSPQDHGFDPVAVSTACWRGYVAGYGVMEGQLILVELNIGLGNVVAPEWRGVQPQQGEYRGVIGDWVYRNVRLPIDYSGGVIIGRGFLQDFYVHMGFHRPHCYREVFELRFEGGRLTTKHDYSDRMEAVRQRIRSLPPDGKAPSNDQIAQFVSEAFSLSYESKWFADR